MAGMQPQSNFAVLKAHDRNFASSLTAVAEEILNAVLMGGTRA
jgi:hypothetical protein